MGDIVGVSGWPTKGAGILNREAIQGFPESDTDTTILVITPETWEFVNSTTLEPPPKVAQATIPKSASGRVSRNPFASPSKDPATRPSTPHSTPAAPARVLAQLPENPPLSLTPTREPRISVSAAATKSGPSSPGMSTSILILFHPRARLRWECVNDIRICSRHRRSRRYSAMQCPSQTHSSKQPR